MKHIALVAAVLASLAGVGRADHCNSCGPTCAPAPVCGPAPCQPAPAPVCEWKEVERTIMVPQWTTEKRKVNVTEISRQVVERKVMVNEYVRQEEKQMREVVSYERKVTPTEEKCWVDVPVWREVEQKFVVQVPYREKRQGKRTVTEQVWNEVDQQYTIHVPHNEVRKEKVTVWRSVPVQLSRKVCEDQGHWEDRPVQPAPCQVAVAPCGSCAPCQPACQPVACTQKVWVPKIVEREVPYMVNECKPFEEEREVHFTVCKPEVQVRKVKTCSLVCREVPYEYEECVWKPEERSCMRKVCDWKKEERVRKFDVVTCVPITRNVEVTVCKMVCVPREKVIQETVCTPVCVEREVSVPVCHMVEKKVMQKVPVYNPCPPAPVCAPACAPVTSCCKVIAPCRSSCDSGCALKSWGYRAPVIGEWRVGCNDCRFSRTASAIPPMLAARPSWAY